MAKNKYLSLDEIAEPDPSTYFSLDDIEGPVKDPSFLENVKDVGTALVEGAEQTYRSGRAAISTYLGNDKDVLEQARKSSESQRKSDAESLKALKEDVQRRKEAGDDTLWQGIKNVAGAVADNPAGGVQLVAEQAPNSAVALGSAWLGAKGGAAIGTALFPGVGTVAGGVVGGISGFLAGLFGANTLLETGGKAIEKASDGTFTPQERSETIGEGLIKGATITGVDVATLGASKFILGAASRAVEDATVRVLTDSGIDAAKAASNIRAAQQAAIESAKGSSRDVIADAVEKATAQAMAKEGLLDPAISAAVQAAQKSAFETATSLPRRLGRGTGVLALESFGEGLGEGLGEYAATGKFSPTEVALESLAGLSQSLPEIYVAKRLNQPGVLTQAMSPRRQLAEDKLKSATNVSDAAAAADELAGSLDELTGSIDNYLAGGSTLAPSAPGQKALQLFPQQRVDREAELLAQAQAATTEFDRRMAMDQIDALRGQAQAGAAAGFVDLTPMSALQAQQRLAILRDQTAREGGNALGLTIVEHPSQPGAFAISQQELPSLDLESNQALISNQEAQMRIESAALAGKDSARREEDSPRQSMISRIMANIEARGGVASPMEAEVLRQANMGQPYNSIDPNLSQSTTPAATTPRETTIPGAVDAANAEGLAEQTARTESVKARTQAELNQQIEETGKPVPLPNANEVISALATPGAQRSAEQTSLINQANNRFDPVDLSIMQRAATAPFQLSAEERVRLKELRNPVANVTETSTTVPESGTTDTGLTGTRVLERLGQPTNGRIITTGAKLSTTRGVAPGATLDINDGETAHQARVVDIGKLGNTGRLISQVGRIFGKRVVAFESDTLQADGFVLPEDNQNIYINTTSQMSPLAVFGHEMTHLLKRDNSEAYSALEAVVQRQLGEGAMDRFTQEYGQGANLEELTSDLVGNRFQEADFWQGVFDEIAAQNPDNARNIIIRTAAAITKAINAFMRLVRQPNFQADQYVKDANEIKKAVRTALATYAQSQKASAMQMEAELAKADPQVDLTAGSRAEPAASATNATDETNETPATREERQREAARTARQQMGETITASPTRRGTAEQIGDYTVRTQKDGSLAVLGDADKIRELMPEGVQGRPVEGGIVFTNSAAPRVRAALEGRKIAYSRGGAVVEKMPMKNGKYVGAPEKFNTPGKIPQLRKWLRQLTDEGAPGRYWYENSGREVLKMVGGDVNEARKFVALLSIYSPQAKVDANSTFALRAWAQYRMGQPISVKTGAQDQKAQGALDDVDAFWSGEKTGNFFYNLLREIDPSTAGKQGATIDMWMMRAGQYPNDAPTATQYAFMENETNRLAQDLGWEPQQVQAAIWVAMKARMENAGVKKRTEASSEKAGWIRYDYPIKNGKPRKTRVILDAQKHRDNWLKHSFEHDPSKEDTAQAKFDFGDGLKRHLGQISFEARPGRTTGVLPGIHNAPYEQQLEFQQAVQAAFLDADGNDRLAQMLGLLVDNNDITVPGVWQGDVSPSQQKLVAMAPSKGDEGKSSVDPDQAKALNLYAAMAGLVARQEGVGWHRPFYAGAKKDANAIDIDLGRPLTPEEAIALERSVGDWMSANDRVDWQDSFAIISSPTGVRLVSFGAVNNDELLSDIVAAAEQALPDFDYRSFVSSGDMAANDWKEYPNGESYVQRASAEGRSDVLGWVRDVLAPRVQRVFDEFSDKYGWGDPGQPLDIQVDGATRQAQEVGARQSAPATSPSEVSQASRQRKPQDIPRQELAGRTLRISVMVEETGQTATIALDADKALADIDEREDTMQRLLECLSK